MSWKIGMPNLGHTMEEGKVSEWLKAVGDQVLKGEVIAVVESDKASFDVESPADGFLTHIHVEGGNTVAVGTAIGEVALHMGAPVSAPTTSTKLNRIAASPVAKKLAQELGIDLSLVIASSPDGLISKTDVQMFADQQMPKAALVKSEPTSNNIRRAISSAVTHSWQNIPHVALHSHANVDVLMKFSNVEVTSSIVRACALALIKHPRLNGWQLEDGFKVSEDVNMGVSISLPSGVVNAVIHQAEVQSIASISEKIKTLAEHAKTKQLSGKDITGASFTVSNLGRWGVDSFAPIIDAPQVAILGVGRIQKVAIESDAGAIAFQKQLSLTLVFDHRANDGVEAAQLLQSIVGYLENPSLMESST